MSVKILSKNDPKFEVKFAKEMRRIGACLVVDHGIPVGTIEAAYAEWMPETGGFFGWPLKAKQRLHWTKVSPKHDDPELGYYPLGSETGSTHLRKNKGQRNENEYYHVKQGVPGSYPCPHGFDASKRLAAMNKVLAFELIDILDRHGPSRKQAPHFGDLCAKMSPHKWSTFRWLHYPPYMVPGKPNEEVELIKTHKDKGCLTTVISPSTSGLQVMDRKGKFHPVPCIKGGIIVQVGEGLELLSNGYYFAGRHTVRGKRKDLRHDRVSAARFWHFKPEVQLTDTFTNGDMMREYWRKKGLEAKKK